MIGLSSRQWGHIGGEVNRSKEADVWLENSKFTTFELLSLLCVIDQQIPNLSGLFFPHSYTLCMKLFRIPVSSVQLPVPRAQIISTQLTIHQIMPKKQSTPSLPADAYLAFCLLTCYTMHHWNKDRANWLMCWRNWQKYKCRSKSPISHLLQKGGVECGKEQNHSLSFSRF